MSKMSGMVLRMLKMLRVLSKAGYDKQRKDMLQSHRVQQTNHCKGNNALHTRVIYHTILITTDSHLIWMALTHLPFLGLV